MQLALNRPYSVGRLSDMSAEAISTISVGVAFIGTLLVFFRAHIECWQSWFGGRTSIPYRANHPNTFITNGLQNRESNCSKTSTACCSMAVHLVANALILHPFNVEHNHTFQVQT